MKHWPHVEVIDPQEKLTGYQPPKPQPSTTDELVAAARQANAQGLDRVVLKAHYPRGYKPYGNTRLVLPNVTGLNVGSTRVWTFVAVRVGALARYCAEAGV